MSLFNMQFKDKCTALVPFVKERIKPIMLSDDVIYNMLFSQHASVIDKMMIEHNVPIPTTIQDMGELLADMMMGELLKFVNHPEELIKGNTPDEKIEKDTITHLTEMYPCEVTVVQHIDIALKQAILDHIKCVFSKH